SPAEYAGVVETERLPGVPVHEVAFGAFLPETTAAILLAGIVARRCVARTIEPVVGPGVRGELCVGAGSPKPFHGGATSLEGGEVVGAVYGDTGSVTRPDPRPPWANGFSSPGRQARQSSPLGRGGRPVF